MCQMNSVFEIPPIGKLPLNPTPACQRAFTAERDVVFTNCLPRGQHFVPRSAIKRSGLALIGLDCCWYSTRNLYLTPSERVIR